MKLHCFGGSPTSSFTRPRRPKLTLTLAAMGHNLENVLSFPADVPVYRAAVVLGRKVRFLKDTSFSHLSAPGDGPGDGRTPCTRPGRMARFRISPPLDSRS